jgi:hypothetical protein
MVSINHIASAPTSNVVNGSYDTLPSHLSLKLFIEAEDGALGGWVDVSSSSSAYLEGLGDVAVKRGQGGGSSSRGTRCDS